MDPMNQASRKEEFLVAGECKRTNGGNEYPTRVTVYGPGHYCTSLSLEEKDCGLSNFYITNQLSSSSGIVFIIQVNWNVREEMGQLMFPGWQNSMYVNE
jgi:hypothetical protein